MARHTAKSHKIRKVEILVIQTVICIFVAAGASTVIASSLLDVAVNGTLISLPAVAFSNAEDIYNVCTFSAASTEVPPANTVVNTTANASTKVTILLVTFVFIIFPFLSVCCSTFIVSHIKKETASRSFFLF